MGSRMSIDRSQLIFNEHEESTRTINCKNNSDAVVAMRIRCSDRRISLEAHTNGFTTCLDEAYYMDPRETLEISVKFEPSASCTNDSAVIVFHSLQDNSGEWIKVEDLPVRIICDKPTPLECSICSEAYAEDSANHIPRILKECGHTVCERCARGLMNRSGNQLIKCPQDQKVTKVENGDIQNLPRNFAVLEILRETPKVVFVPCGEDPSHQAVLFCTSCLVDFCEKCFEQVHSLRVFSKHQKVPISEKPIQLPKCPTHTYNNAEFLCKSPECGENTVICHTCILGHHKGHPYENLMGKLIENEKRASDLLDKLQSARKNYIEKLTVANDNRASFSTGSQEFKHKSEKISEHFKQKEEDAIQNLRDYCSVKGKHLDERIEELKKDSRSVLDLIGKIDSIWKTKKDLHLVEEMNEKVMELCELSVISEPMNSSISFVQKQLTFKDEINSTRTVYCRNNSDEVVVIVIRCSDRRISLEAHTNGYPTCLEEGYYMDPRETLEISVKFKPSASCTNHSALIKLHSLHDKYDKWIKLLELPVCIISEMKTPQLSMEVYEEQERDKPTPLECSICSEAYAEDSANHTPRVLKECGHTVCERCARGLMNKSGNQKIKCPHDQKETKVENEDIENLPRNFDVLEVIRETPKVVFVPCGEDPSHKAVLFCTSCLVDFCEKCFEQVHSSKTLSKHQKVPVSEKPIQLPKCPTHPYNNAEFLCKSPDCGGTTVICHTCILGKHKEHHYENLMEKLIENEKNAADLLDKLESARKNYIEKLTVTNDNRASFSTGNQEFKQKSEEISKYFKQKEEEAIQNLRDYCSAKGKDLDERIEELKKDSKSVHDLIGKIDTIWKTKKDLHLVEEMNEKVMEMCELSVISEDHQSLDQSCISWKDGIEAVFQ